MVAFLKRLQFEDDTSPGWGCTREARFGTFAVFLQVRLGMARRPLELPKQPYLVIPSVQHATRGFAEAIYAISQTISQIDVIANHIAAAVESQEMVTRDISTSMQQVASGTTEISNRMKNIVSVTGVANASLNELKARSEAMVA